MSPAKAIDLGLRPWPALHRLLLSQRTRSLIVDGGRDVPDWVGSRRGKTAVGVEGTRRQRGSLDTPCLVEAKLAFRGRTRDAMTAELATKEARFEKLWTLRLGQQMATLPPFDDVFRAVRRSLRDAGLVER